MRLVFVHGMRQEGQDPIALKGVWESALARTWQKLGLSLSNSYELEMPFYGDVLDGLTNQLYVEESDIIARGSAGPRTFSPLQESLLRGMSEKAGVLNQDVERELGQEVVARSPANWEWVQALARVLERKSPALGKFVLAFVVQVDAYLTRPHIKQAVDEIVAPTLNQGPTVIVAHSLGTIVSYTLLRGMTPSAQVPLFMTLGSPLGIEMVKSYLRPPSLAVPPGVMFWMNGADERDYVALVSKLDATTFAAGILNDTAIYNRNEDAHSIEDYLSDLKIAQRIYLALK
jgi:hypothetical protein